MDVLELLRSGTPEDWTILQAHGVIRRTDRVENVTGDYAEFLVNEHFGGTLQPPGNPNYDIEAEDHGRISVKSRRNYYQHFSVAQGSFRTLSSLSWWNSGLDGRSWSEASSLGRRCLPCGITSSKRNASTGSGLRASGELLRCR